MARPYPTDRGPFRADQLRPGDPYELSRGHAILLEPTGGRGAEPNGLGFAVLASDPAVREAGVDVGYTPEPGTLRAPDVAIGNVPDVPGWVPGVPQLAVEYADVGTDEAKLQGKIADLLEWGTRAVWVVRLAGPRRVEVYEPGRSPRTVGPGETLTAPGILRNPVPALALFDREAAHAATMRNRLQRAGYSGLEAVRAEGREEGRAEGREEGRAEGREEGRAEGLRQGIRDLCAVLAIEVDPAREALLAGLGVDRLEALRGDLVRVRHWPDDAARR